MAEIVRAGIQSVDIGQTEAARTLGMTAPQTMLNIILPQAIKNAFPAMGNEFIVNIKDSSVLNVISVTELFFQAKSIAGSLYKYEETFFVTAMIYLVLTAVTSFLLHLVEKRLNNTRTSFPSSSSTTRMVNNHHEGGR
ncbi:putative glutamine ABC transporter permease protein GlnM [bioreactor metagenome]|uniref:Putative glutamine ABC transporter permease protein GlnM n=1 Tax=bioreactor metagenome TaxID=1076179 RepID=A0A645AY24_9ZZZZ